MLMQPCCRDQRKMGQVIDQIKMLANNLDELRLEINALKTNDLKKEDGFPQPSGTMKNNILKKFKRYMKKVTSINSLRNWQKSDNHETYFTCTNTEPPVPSFLNYILRIGKRGDVWQIPTRVKYVKHKSNQTDAELDNRVVQNKAIASEKYLPISSKYSDISCELDSRVETPYSSAINIPSNLSTIQIETDSENTKADPSNDIDKRFTAASTQTSTGKNRKLAKFPSNHPNIYFSKIKKIIKNSNDSTFTICKSNYPYLKKKLYGQYPYDNEKRNNYGKKVDKTFSLNRIIEKLKDVSSAKEDIVQEEHGSSSSSVSVDLELTVSSSSSKINELSERRKPRTYVIHKTSQKRDQNNWSNSFEKSVIYVGSTSDLTLFSSSFLN